MYCVQLKQNAIRLIFTDDTLYPKVNLLTQIFLDKKNKNFIWTIPESPNVGKYFYFKSIDLMSYTSCSDFIFINNSSTAAILAAPQRKKDVTVIPKPW